MMTLLGDAFDAKHLTNTVTGQPRSLEFRVQFHYNDHGQLKQISPWHDIPLYTPCGNVNMVVEIPKCAAPEPTGTALPRPHRAAAPAPRCRARTALPRPHRTAPHRTAPHRTRRRAPRRARTAAPAPPRSPPEPLAQVVARQVRDRNGRRVQPN
jgi:hypothetical protein